MRLRSPTTTCRPTCTKRADDRLSAAGYDWYEVSNWATSAATRSRHNLAYWTGQDWWGIGPGAHSHIGGVRWWNVKHPAAYASRLEAGESPAAGRETLDASTRRVEGVLLRTRLADGLPTASLDAAGKTAVAGLIGDGLVDGAAAIGGQRGAHATRSVARGCRRAAASRVARRRL